MSMETLHFTLLLVGGMVSCTLKPAVNRGHVLRYPDDDVVSETITKFCFTLDFHTILTTTPPHVENGRRQTPIDVKCGRKKWSHGRLCLLLFALSVHSICVSGN